jgi:hypothetical protein
LRGEGLTSLEYHKVNQHLDLYPAQEMNLSAYAIAQEYSDLGENIDVFCKDNGKRRSHKVVDIIGALNNTGIPYLERYIQTAQIESERFGK